MDIVLSIGRKVVVDNSADVLDIEATGSHVSRNHDGAATSLEVLEGARTLVLVLISVNGGARNLALQAPLELVAHLLGRAEDDDAGTTTLIPGQIMMRE